MGLLDKFRKGGGFLNNVDGLVIAGGFTVTPDFGNGPQEQEVKEGNSTPLWYAVQIRVDGGDKVDSLNLYAGSADDFVISEDGQTLTPATEGAAMWGGTAFQKFYESFVLNGGEDVEPEEDGSLNFGRIVGARARFVQVKDEDAMKRAAKNYKKSKGKINELGQRKGTDGKFYDQKSLQVESVYSLDNDVTEAAAPVSGKGKKAVAGKTAGNATKQAKGPVAPAIDEFAQETLIALLKKAKGNTLKQTDLNVQVTRALVNDSARREDVRKFLTTPANLQAIAESGAITFNKGVIGLSAEA